MTNWNPDASLLTRRETFRLLAVAGGLRAANKMSPPPLLAAASQQAFESSGTVMFPNGAII